MDAQLKRGMLEGCVLAVLSRGDSYGYQLVKEVGACVEISESTLYPILKRLETAGCLDTYREAYNGRLRKYYRLTAQGEERICGFLAEWEEMERIYQFVKEKREGTSR